MDILPLNNTPKVVAIGGGHGLGRVLSSLSFLGRQLSGIVATTDNGGSTGRLREQHGCIAWGDLRNCLSQLAHRPSVGSMLFEYRFDGNSELSGHNLGNLILYALDELCVRPLDAVNLIRGLLKVECQLIPMSEQPTHLVALDKIGKRIIGELSVDRLSGNPESLSLEPMVQAPQEACDAIADANLIVLGPGSFLTSTLPALLIPKIAAAIKASNAEIILVDNLTPEHSPAANQLSIGARVEWCHRLIGRSAINRVLCHHNQARVEGLLHFMPLQSLHHPGLHDPRLLAGAIMKSTAANRLIA